MSSSDAEQLALHFQQLRPHLQRVAYAILGSLSEAEDVVQDAWLRLERHGEPGAIRDLQAWLTTTVSRLALDALRSARRRRERYVGTWLPEPLVQRVGAVALGGGSAALAADPIDQVSRDESVSLALLIVLERLTPAERVAFVLHDIFGLRFAEVAEVIGATPAGARKLAQRARSHVQAGRPARSPCQAEHRQLVLAFAKACERGDLDGLLELLDHEVVWRTDGGGQVNAARQIHRGAGRVARAMLALSRRRPLAAGYLALINGAPGLVVRDVGGTVSVISLTVDCGRIVAIDIIRNPEKLTAVPAP